MTALTHEDSAALADALRKLLADRYDFATARRQELAAGAGELPPIWRSLVELGLCGLVLPEVHGGFGGGVADLQHVQRELGRALVVAPWFGTALCAQAIALAGTPAQRAALLPALAQGSLPMALADGQHPEFTDAHASVQARCTGGRWLLDGLQTAVAHAGCAARLLVRAQLPAEGGAWFVVNPAQAGVQRRDARLVDNSWAADLQFTNAAGERLGDEDAPASLRTEHHEALCAAAVAGRAAEAVGAAEAALEATVQHLRTRQQFGQALGDYQSLRHRVAEMAIALEQARSGAELALEAALGEPAGRPHRAAQAQWVSSESVTWILQQAIQLHGGMGMTDELAVGHHYRRMLVLNALSGGSSGALARLTR